MICVAKAKKSVSSELKDEFKKELKDLKKEFAEFKEEFVNSANAKKKKDDSEALFIPAGVLTGMGVGFWLGNIPAGLFLGLGIGFVLFAIIAVIKGFKH